MTIDLNKIPDEIPAIWILALALIEMSPDSEDHVALLRVNFSGYSGQSEIIASSLIRRCLLRLAVPGNFSRYTLTTEGHRLLDLVEA